MGRWGEEIEGCGGGIDVCGEEIGMCDKGCGGEVGRWDEEVGRCGEVVGSQSL